MAVEIATAYFSLLPSMAGTAAAVRTGLGSAAVGTAFTQAGATQGVAMGTGVASGLGRAVGPIAIGLAALGVVDFFDKAIDKASDLNESANAVRVTFGDAADEVAKLGETASTRIGLSQTDFNSLAVRFSNFATTVAGDSRGVADVLAELTGRAADFASVMNMDVAEASTLFQSGLAGESEPLRRYGIDVSAATVAATAYRLGIAEVGAELTEQQKVQARYAAIMEQTSEVQGDFANTSDDLANRQRINAARFDDAAAAIGTALLPAAQEFEEFASESLLPLLEKFAPILEDWAPLIADATEAFLAFSSPSLLNSLLDMLEMLDDGKFSMQEFADIIAKTPDVLGDTYINFVNFINDLFQTAVGFVNNLLEATMKPINAVRSLFGLSALTYRIDIPNVSVARSGNVGNMSVINGQVRTRMAGLANGGVLDTEGAVRVGEYGPEILYLPQNAQVHPLPAAGSEFSGRISGRLDLGNGLVGMIDGRIQRASDDRALDYGTGGVA